jgi:hypothetical protein
MYHDVVVWNKFIISFDHILVPFNFSYLKQCISYVIVEEINILGENQQFSASTCIHFIIIMLL